MELPGALAHAATSRLPHFKSTALPVEASPPCQSQPLVTIQRLAPRSCVRLRRRSFAEVAWSPSPRSTVSGRQTNAMEPSRRRQTPFRLRPSLREDGAPVVLRLALANSIARRSQRCLLAPGQGHGGASRRLLIDGFARKRRRRPSDPRQHENRPPAVHHRVPSPALARTTLIRLRASQLRISQLAGSLILWTRAWTILPPAVLYGGAMTSHSPVSLARRSPTRSSIGRILLSAADCSRFLEERGRVNSVPQSKQPQVPNTS
jgi:hypothetical protein